MSEDKTQLLGSFQGQVLTRLDDIGARLTALEKRVGEIDATTKPNWDRLHADFAQLHTSMTASFGNIGRKLDVMNREFFQMKADQDDIKTRLDKVESEARPQTIVQDR